MSKLLLTRQEAAEQLSMSLTHFSESVQPNLRIVRSGRLVRVPASELARWVDEQKGFAG